MIVWRCSLSLISVKLHIKAWAWTERCGGETTAVTKAPTYSTTLRLSRFYLAISSLRFGFVFQDDRGKECSTFKAGR